MSRWVSWASRGERRHLIARVPGGAAKLVERERAEALAEDRALHLGRASVSEQRERGLGHTRVRTRAAQQELTPCGKGNPGVRAGSGPRP